MKVTKVFVVPHVHWDREWYFTCEESQVLAVRDFTEVLDHLEANPEYPSYILDGQMAVVDEYVNTVPGAGERIGRLVREGRLHVGPWYTQTDEMIVGGESIVRNLLYGLESARRFGDPMLVGYVPDSFGQSAAMPMILNQFGIRRSVFWRGQSQFSGTKSNQFWWESQDGSRVLVNQLPLGYATGKYLQTDPEALRRRLGPLFALMDEIASTPYAILPNGHDQMPIQTNIEDALAALRIAFPDREFVLGSLDDELDCVELGGGTTGLPEVRGEFLDGKRERVHRSIFSVRMDNAALTTRVENLLTRRVDPLVALTNELGMGTPRELVRQAWRPLLESHAHDSMGGCCSDKVNTEIAARLTNVLERAELLERYQERFVTEAVDLPFANRVCLFNMSPTPGARTVRAEVLTCGNAFELVDADGDVVPYDVIATDEVDPGLVDRQIVASGNYQPFLRTTVELLREVPTVGYEALGVREVEAVRPEPAAATDACDFTAGLYTVHANTDGTLDIVTAGGTTCLGALGIEVEGNDGDEYDFSPLYDGGLIRSQDMVSCVPQVCEHEHTVEVSLVYDLTVPADIAGWRGEHDRRAIVGVSLLVTFDRHSPAIDVRVTLDNHADDCRVRLLVPTSIASEVSYASNQFGQIERQVVDPGMAVWQEERWSERPDAIYPFLDYVALADGTRTAAVLTNGPREYEVVGDAFDTLAITLLAAVGTLGKPDLVRRPGRPSGISVDTPDAQCHGKLELQLGLVLCDRPLCDASLGTIAAQWLTPVDSYQRFDYVAIQLSAPKAMLPARFGLLSQANSALVPTSVKITEDGSRVIARFYNETASTQRIELSGSAIDGFLDLAERDVPGCDMVSAHSVVTLALCRDGGAAC